MNADIEPWLYNILDAINAVYHTIGRKTQNFTVYNNDAAVKTDINKHLELLSNGVTNIVAADGAIVFTNKDNIIKYCEYIVSTTDQVINETVWLQLFKYLNILHTETLLLIAN